MACGAEPPEAIRAIACGVFDAIDAHPWAGAELSREPWQPAVLQIFESFGGQLQAFGVPGPAQFDCASALLNYVLGLAGQRQMAAQLPGHDDREQFLAGIDLILAGITTVR